jgi:hypothetical protein
MDLSRPAVIGITTPGNKTMLRKGKIVKNLVISFIISSSSSVNKVLIQHLNQIEVTDCQ